MPPTQCTIDSTRHPPTEQELSQPGNWESLRHQLADTISNPTMCEGLGPGPPHDAPLSEHRCVIWWLCAATPVASQHVAWAPQWGTVDSMLKYGRAVQGCCSHCNPKHAAPPSDCCQELATPLNQDAFGKGEWGGPQQVPRSHLCGGSCLCLADGCLALCQAQSLQHICARAIAVPLAISIVLHSREPGVIEGRQAGV